MREACYFYEILTGKLGRAIVVLVLISLGISWSIGKLEMKQLLTVFLGVVLFFGSFQIVKYLMGRNDIGYCNLIDYSQPVGMPSYALIEKKSNQ
jgi:type IV secretory pathway VirB2 component (pilin)